MRLAPALLLALLLAPMASAHISGARPIYQRAELDRNVLLEPDGLAMGYTLTTATDPLRQGVRHRLEPHTGRVFVEHRADASVADDAFQAQWELERLLEYRDLNLDGRWQPESDTAVRVWRFSHYPWRIGGIQRVQVADVQTESAVWTANLSGAPGLRLEAVAAGKSFSDEGAIMRPQDVALYFDVRDLPPRETGSLYALEVRARVDADTALSLHVAEETPTALLAERDRRLAMLVWGGEVLTDGFERRIEATLQPARVDDFGDNKTALLLLHLPPAEREMRFVIVSALEYLIEVRRGTPGLPLVLVLGALVVATLSRRNR